MRILFFVSCLKIRSNLTFSQTQRGRSRHPPDKAVLILAAIVGTACIVIIAAVAVLLRRRSVRKRVKLISPEDSLLADTGAINPFPVDAFQSPQTVPAPVFLSDGRTMMKHRRHHLEAAHPAAIQDSSGTSLPAVQRDLVAEDGASSHEPLNQSEGANGPSHNNAEVMPVLQRILARLEDIPPAYD